MSAVAVKAAPKKKPSARPRSRNRKQLDFTPVTPVAELEPLWVPKAQQWVGTTRGRVVTDGVWWTQAVHWVDGSGLFVSRAVHGPRTFGGATRAIVELLVELSPCRPTVAYLARETGLSERTVQNHLRLLREAGLLVYVRNGQLLEDGTALAAEYALVVPPQFDDALGIRTVLWDGNDPGWSRAAVGIAEAGRALIAELAKKAAVTLAAARAAAKKRVKRKRAEVRTRRAEQRAALKARAERIAENRASAGVVPGTSAVVPEGGRCTPMGVLTLCSCLTECRTKNPNQSKLATGNHESSPAPVWLTKHTDKRRRRPLNRVGRRYQLAGEITRQLPWLGNVSVGAVAKVVKRHADAHWTAPQLMGWIASLGPLPATIHRPVSFLAGRLRHSPVTASQAQLDYFATCWTESTVAAEIRHEDRGGDTRLPQNPRSREELTRAQAHLYGRGPIADEDALVTSDGSGPGLRLEDFSEEDIRGIRAEGRENPDRIRQFIRDQGEDWARALYGKKLVADVMRLAKASRRLTLGRIR